MSEKGKKKAVAKIKKISATHKRMDQFVASFSLDGKTIQEQRSYKDAGMLDQDREILAELNGVSVDKIMPHITDNRNMTEKEKAGVNVGKKEKDARKAVKDAEAKDRLLLDEPAIPLPPAYKPETPEDRLRSYDEISREIAEHRRSEADMKQRHSEEKKAWEARDSELHAELEGLRQSQMDLFKHPAPAAAEEFDFDIDFNGMDIAAGGDLVRFMPVITGEYDGDLRFDISIADAPAGLSVAEYLLAVRDCLEREPGVTSVSMAWATPEPAQDGPQAPDQAHTTGPAADPQPSEPGQAETGNTEA